MEGQEQNRTEEATPFKLKRAREKGQVARGMDVGFVGSLLALTMFALFVGPTFIARLADIIRLTLTSGIDRAALEGEVLATVRSIYWIAFQPLLIFAAILILVLILLELIQLRGFMFTATPLKPDLKRLNPIQGLKRLFSVRMIKETLKNLIKISVYVALAWIMITSALEIFGDSVTDASALAAALDSGAKRLVFAFICAAVFFMAVDQIIVRSEFRKQMRMSKRELTRETKDREGEPRFKQKRRELHAQMRERSEGLAGLDSADIMIVNPEHYAVALAYVPDDMSAPEVKAMGRNHFAQLLKRRARLLGLPVVSDPPLARALFADSQQNAPIAGQHFHAVARHYSHLGQFSGGKLNG